MLNRLVAGVLLAALVAMGAAACSGDDDDGGSGDGLAVLASNAIVADWVGQVGGEMVDVGTLVRSGADVHTYQLRPSDVRAIVDADVAFLVGAGLEASFEDAVFENAEREVVELSEGLELAALEGQEEDDGHDHGDFDPHIWMDAGLAADAVTRIAEVLASVDAENAATYEANAAAYIDEIETMDSEIRSQLAALPEEEKLLVTFHDAYGYFADRYGLTVLGFVVENADEEPSASRVAELVDAIRDSGAPAIYREPQFNASVVEQVANEADVEVRILPSDTLSGEYGTYIELMRAMAAAITG